MKKLLPIILLFISYLEGFSAPTQISDFIRIDQFGYRTKAKKVAVIINPLIGFNANQSFNPSVAANQYQVRKWDNDEVVFTGTLEVWNNGATDPSSGDRAWWFDFSSVSLVGSYYIYDVGNRVGSFKFDIRDDVYSNLLRVALRMFYYNRCNAEKKLEHAGVNYVDGASFVGVGQDREARSERDRNNPATAKDLSGGWWDAGDYNKYTTFAHSPMHQLLEAYEHNPTIWGDNNKIPESGNGIPDLIDEIKWELDWLKKMQLPEGNALIKVGNLKDTDGPLPPSTDRRPRYYYPNGCSSATISLASIFAHAAITLKTIPALIEYANDLQQRAISAYRHYNMNPKQTDCDNGNIQAGDADWDIKTQEKVKIQTAVYLYALTGENTYKETVEKEYRTVVDDIAWWGPYNVTVTEALLYFTRLSNVSNEVANAIRNSKIQATNQDFYKWNTKDPYRAFMRNETYHWGSLNIRANTAILNMNMITYNLDPANHEIYRQRAEEILHYFHGVNPLNTVYLSNMSMYGAEKSLNEIYHSWFKDGSAWDNPQSAKGGPAPGYVPGGPNKDYKPGQGNCILSPPCNQPVQKSYRDWNGIWPDASWEVTEPAIYYQSAYIKALSYFATASNTDLPLPSNTTPTGVKKNEIPENQLKVFPNPSKNKVQIQFITSKSEDTNISITDVTGKILKAINYTFTAQEANFEIEISQFPRGIYLIHLSTNQLYGVKKLVVE
ncbi:MAG: hypothetical protein OHK0057_34820 [Thermoflexibacter sp.]